MGGSIKNILLTLGATLLLSKVGSLGGGFSNFLIAKNLYSSIFQIIVLFSLGIFAILIPIFKSLKQEKYKIKGKLVLSLILLFVGISVVDKSFFNREKEYKNSVASLRKGTYFWE